MPDGFNLESAVDANLSTLESGVTQALNALSAAFAAEALGEALPIIGSELKDAFDAANPALRKLESLALTIRDAIAAARALPESSASAVQSTINSYLSSHGFGGTSVVCGIDGATGQLTLAFAANITATASNISLASDFGLPGLNLATEGTVNANLNFDFDFTIGVDGGGFYLGTSANRELDVTLSLTAPQFSADAQLGFLNFGATDSGSHLNGHFYADLVDADGHMRLNELSSLYGSGLVTQLTADGGVNLHLTGDMGDAMLPSISADLVVDWDFLNVNLNGSGANDSSFGGVPTVSFQNVEYQFGTFVETYIRPLFEQIEPILGPVKDVLAIFNSRITFLENWVDVLDVTGAIENGNDVPDGYVTLLDFIKMASDAAGLGQDFAPLIQFVNLVEDIVGWGEFFAGHSFGPDGYDVSLGGFQLPSGTDIRNLATQLENLTPQVTAGAQNLSTFLSGLTGGDYSAGGRDILQDLLTGGPDSAFAFPILTDPMQVFKLLLGGDADFFHLNLPEVNFGFGGFDGDGNPTDPQLISLIPVFPFINVRLAGAFEIAFDLAFGMDTRGVQAFIDSNFTNYLAFANGFYVSDNIIGGVDHPELSISAGLMLSVEASIYAASVGGGGDIVGQVFIDLNDTVNGTPADGRVYLDEFGAAFVSNPFSLFDVYGRITAGLSAYVSALGFEVWSLHSPRITLANFDSRNPPQTNVDVHLASVSGGVLTLNVGDLAGQRDTARTEINEEIFVSAGTNVAGWGAGRNYSGVTQIVGNGGGGRDTLALDANLNIAAVLHGNTGDDILQGGAAGDQLFGDDGTDELYGQGGSDVLEGGAARDFLYGGDGTDTLRGQDGDDVLIGGAGADAFFGGAGFDGVTYELSNVAVQIDLGLHTAHGGEAEGDTFDSVEMFFGSSAGDTLIGGALGDLLYGLNGDDTLSGGLGADVLTGGLGADVLNGGDGFDTASYARAGQAITLNLQTGVGTGEALGDTFISIERIEGTAYNDVITGRDDLVVGDRLFGGAGADTLNGGLGDDTLAGGAGADAFNGGGGSDLVSYVGSGVGITADLVSGGVGGDAQGDTFSSIERLEGADLDVNGVALADILRGDNGANTLSGLAGNDRLEGRGGVDLLEGGAGDDQLYGDEGDDILVGGAGADAFHGGAGADTVSYRSSTTGVGVNLTTGAVSGDATGDTFDSIANIEGTDQVDALTGDGGVNVLSGFVGNDTLIGLAGADTLRGGQGADIIDGGTEADILYGDEGNDDIQGGAGADRLYGGADNDTLNGGADGDFLYGEGGVDLLNGGDGADELRGGDQNDALNGGTGGDTLYGDAGIDVLNGEAGQDILYGGTEGDTLDGGADEDQLFGDAGADILRGGDAADTLVGGADNDSLDGGAGFDTADYSASTSGVFINLTTTSRTVDGVTVAAGQGRDGLGGTDALSNIERLLGSTAADILYAADVVSVLEGGAGGDRLNGGSADDRLVGGSGADTLNGGGGFDMADYTGSSGAVRVNLGATAFTLGGVSVNGLRAQDGLGSTDTLTAMEGALGSANDDYMVGGAGQQRLVGNNGADWLDGAAGDDILDGGAGNDTYYVDSLGDQIIENGGYDRVYASLDYSLAPWATVEELNLIGGARRGTGNGLANLIYGTDFDDVLDGSTNDDQLYGGLGNDTYVFDTMGDRALEADNAGTDLIQLYTGGLGLNPVFSIDVAWAQGIENVTLMDAVSPITVIGNALNNTLTGSTNNETLYGGGGDDRLVVMGGVDNAYGQSGTDTLVVQYGGTTQAITWGTNNYGTYWFTGTSNLGVTFSEIERFELTTGSGADSLTTFDGSDIISAGAGDDIIASGQGWDVIDGGTGVDWWRANQSALTSAQPFVLNLRLTGVQGTYGVGGSVSGIERLELTTGEGADVITTMVGAANAWNDSITTNGGNDRVVVGAGVDGFSGGDGTDTLVVEYGWSTENFIWGTNNYGTYWLTGSGPTSVSWYSVERFEITTGSGADDIRTGDLNDIVFSGSGADYIQSYQGFDVIDGGAGIDWWESNQIALAADQGFTLNLRLAGVQGTYGTGGSVTGIERLSLTTGAGADVITTLVGAANAYNDSITTNGGDDRVVFGAGVDGVNGGDGTDTLVIEYGWSAENFVWSTNNYGTFWLTGSGGTQSSWYSVERFEITTGSGADDVRTGDLNDVVSTGAGADFIQTYAGWDVVDGGSGVDWWNANQAALSAQQGFTLDLSQTGVQGTFGVGGSVRGIERLSLTTGEGADVITTLIGAASAWNDTLVTSGGADRVVFGGGVDYLNGGDGFDNLVLDYRWSNEDFTWTTNNYGTFWLTGSAGTQAQWYSVEQFEIRTGNGVDQITTYDGADTLVTAGGDDIVNSGTGQDYISLGDGVDWWLSNQGGLGADQAMNLNLTRTGLQGTFGPNGQVRGVERLTLYTGAAADVIVTLGGASQAFNDVLYTGGGDDRVTFGAGSDYMEGGDGLDTLVLQYGWSSENFIYSTNNYGTHWLTGSGGTVAQYYAVERFEITTGSGNDEVHGFDANDILITGAGADRIFSGAGFDVIDGGLGIDLWNANQTGLTAAQGFTLDLSLTGLQGTFGVGGSVSGIERLALTTGAGNDDIRTLVGAANPHNDIVILGAGDDRVTVGGGADAVAGQSGIDTLVVDYSWQNAAIVWRTDNYGNYWLANADDSLSVAYSEIERFEIRTGGGADNITTGGYDDRIETGAGDDNIRSYGGFDYIDGGSGVDRWEGDLSGQIVAADIDLSRSGVQGTWGTGSVRGVERLELRLGEAADSVVTLMGGALRNDIIYGNGGDDYIALGGGFDAVSGGYGTDTLLIDYSFSASAVTASTNNYGVYYHSTADGLHQAAYSDVDRLIVRGGSADDSLQGLWGDDWLKGGSGNDTLNGGDGLDTADFSDVTGALTITLNNGATLVVATSNRGTDTLVSIEGVHGGRGGDTLTGDGQANRLEGDAGDDWLRGGGGADTLDGGAGVDTADYADQTAAVVATLMGASVSTVTVGGVADDRISNIENLTGGSGDDVLTGDGQANILTGGLGADRLTGGLGDDTYYVDNAGDVIVEGVGGGLDRVFATASVILSANVEQLILTGAADINGTGNALDNRLTGNAGANVLDGGLGADVMIGGLGDDTYYVDNVGDVVTEASNQGVDTVISSVSFSLSGQNADNLTLTGTANLNATGNGLANRIVGNSGNNVIDGGKGVDVMDGGKGDDLYYVDEVTDVVIESANRGNDSVIASVSFSLVGQHVENLTLTGTGNSNATGNGLNNILIGNSGDNDLNGDAGADVMTGGLGDDNYFVDDIGDVVNELDGQGHDSVRATISYILGAFVEDLTLGGLNAINGTGNALDNVIVGNKAANVIDGGLGADAMSGGKGDDTYYVDNVGDVVTEKANSGTDTVISAVSFNLNGQHIENLTLTGTAALNATGNGLNNILIGNAGANVIDGGGGIDAMTGGKGDDIYYVDNAGDTVIESSNQGTDTVISSVGFSLAGQQVENLTLTGAAAINATGNGLANILIGNAGANVITGGGAADTLTGGGGIDTFVFSALSDSTTAARDRITDFGVDDILDFRLIDANTRVAGDQAFVQVGAFTNHAGELVLTYDAGLNQTTLSLDNNGDGVADFQLLLNGQVTGTAGWLL